MASRTVPETYAELRDAIDNAELPHERYWLDYKRELYTTPPPGMPTKTKSKRETHLELARDLASLAERGGYLIFGVDEDKQNHSFTVVDMPLPAQLDQAIDQVARTLITPPLLVTPTLLTNPANPGYGLMLVEVPESPDAPHMVDGVYYGRSETGKVKLSDERVEYLISRRGRTEARLADAMAETAAVDPFKEAEAAHLYFTAVPTQGWPEMMLDLTKDNIAQTNFSTGINNTLGNEINQADRPGRNDTPLAFGWLVYNRRSPRQRGAVFTNFRLDDPNDTTNPTTYLAIGDNGTVRYIDLAAGSLRDGAYPSMAGLPPEQRLTRFGKVAVVYTTQIFYHALDLVRLVARVARDHNYTGSWMLGLSLVNMHGRYSDLTATAASDTDELTATHRATIADLADRPDEVAAALLRPMFRDLGVERSLDGTLAQRASARQPA
jgi:hypothetical protein